MAEREPSKRQEQHPAIQSPAEPTSGRPRLAPGYGIARTTEGVLP